MNKNKILEDLELIKSAKSGNHESFSKLLKIHFDKSQGNIQQQFRLSYHDLEDIKQIVSIKLWSKLNHFKNGLNFYNWFYTIFKNETVSFLMKSNEINKNELTNVILNAEKDYINENPHKFHVTSLDIILNDTAQTFLEKKEQIDIYKRTILSLFGKLKNNHKQMLELVLLEEKSYKEISKILKIPIGSVMSRFFYAKKQAKKILKEMSKNKENNFVL